MRTAVPSLRVDEARGTQQERELTHTHQRERAHVLRLKMGGQPSKRISMSVQPEGDGVSVQVGARRELASRLALHRRPRSLLRCTAAVAWLAPTGSHARARLPLPA